MDIRLKKLVDIAGGLRGSKGAVSVNAEDFCFLVDSALAAAGPVPSPPKRPKPKTKPAAEDDSTSPGITHEAIDKIRRKADAQAAGEQLGLRFEDDDKLSDMKAALHKKLDEAEQRDADGSEPAQGAETGE